MRILITGGAGFIGSHLTERLLAEGHEVRVLDNLSTGRCENLPSHQGLELVRGDIRAQEAMGAVSGVEAIYHLAAVASVQASVEDPRGTHESNFIGTLNLLEAARRHGVRRFLYASSAAVYGDTADLPVGEEATTRPLTPYAADKLAGEHYLDFYGRKHGLAGSAFRFFNVYGPRQDPSSPYSGVISIFVERMLQDRAVTIFGDGRQTRDFVYVGDLAKLLASALNNDHSIGQVLNVGRGVECSLLELLAELEKLAGRRIERRHEPERIGDIRRSRARVARLRQVFGHVPQTPIGAGLAKLLARADAA